MQRNVQVLHVGGFLRACAALGIPAGEHSPFESFLWKRRGGRFRRTHWYVFRSLCHAMMSLSALSFCLQSLHLRWSTTSALEESRQKKNQPSLSNNMPHCIAVFASDCLRFSVMNITVSRLSCLVSSCLNSGSTTTHM